MDERDVLAALLIGSVLLAVLLILAATAAIGRKLTDLEYQVARGITGAPRIQSWIALRTQIDRALLGIVFVIINSLLLAGAPEIWRMWTNRVAWTVLLSLVLISAVLDWLDERRQVRLVIAHEDALAARLMEEAAAIEQQRSAALQSDRDSYRQMADEAVSRLEDAVRQSAGVTPPAPPLAAVVPEHNSPVTPEQQAEADRQTMRARLVASTLALGLPAREATAPAAVPGDPLASVDVATIQDSAVQAIADAVNANQEPRP